MANAYYNLGHALQAKNDLTDALTQYETVKSLVANNPASLKEINQEIAALNKQISKEQGNQQQVSAPVAHTPYTQTPLKLSSPSAQLPQKQNPIKIPAPTVSITPTTTPTPTPTK